jgi:tetratricopeptide (TPR) repeat protein
MKQNIFHHEGGFRKRDLGLALKLCLCVSVVDWTCSVSKVLAAEPLMDTDVLLVSCAIVQGSLQNGGFNAAIQAEEKALKIVQDQNGPLHPTLVPLLNDLGTLERCMAQYPQAEQNYKWGLAIREKVLGPDDPGVAESLDYLAGLDLDLGWYAEAELDYQRALTIQERSFGKNSPEVASTLEPAGNLSLLMGQAAKARTTIERCTRIREKTWGPDDPKWIGTLELSARISEAQGDLASAENSLKRALVLRQKVSTLDSLEMADSLESLARFYHRQGRPEARTLYEGSAKIRDRLLGTDSYAIQTNLHSAALTDIALGRLKEAEALLDRVLKFRKGLYGPGHPKVAFGLEDLGDLYKMKGQDAKAVAYWKEAKGILGNLLDPDHPEILRIDKKLESLSKKQ